MIRLDRRELLDLAGNVLLANTPYSLYHALVKTSAVHRMKVECEPIELEGYYDRITVRARQTEIELGIAYGVLVALLTSEKARSTVDVSRLKWGEEFKELVEKSGRATQSIIIQASAVRPTLRNQQSPGGTGLF